MTNTNESQINPPTRAWRVNWLSSYVVLAGIGLALANGLAMATLKHDPADSPNRSWAYWCVKDWQKAKKENKKPDVVFFGSSLVVSLIDDGNASFQNQILDSVKNHRSTFFESYTEKLLGKPIHTQSFAIGGQMASDTCALFRATTAKEDARPLLVWGIGPRDLLDSSFHNPATTETVRYLDRISYPEDVLPESKSLWKKIERQIEKSVFLYGKRADLQALERDTAQEIISKTVGTTFNTIKAPKQLLRIAAAEQPEDSSEGQWMVAPYSQKAARHKYWSDNSKEYSMRYQPFRPKTFSNQAMYLEKFLQQTQQMGFPVLLVNMPILDENRELIPPGVYEKYLSCVSELAQKNGAKFLDCNQSKTFSRADFCDPVHLHGMGAHKLLRVIAGEMKTIEDDRAIADKNHSI